MTLEKCACFDLQPRASAHVSARTPVAARQRRGFGSGDARSNGSAAWQRWQRDGSNDGARSDDSTHAAVRGQRPCRGAVE